MKKKLFIISNGLSGLIGFTSLATSCSIHFNPQPTPEPETDVKILQKDVKTTADHWQTATNVEIGFELELSKQLKENEKIQVDDCKFVSQIGNTFDENNLLYDYPALNFFKDDSHLVLNLSLNRKSTPNVGDKCVFNMQISSSENTIAPFWINDLSVTISDKSAPVPTSDPSSVFGESEGQNGSLFIPITSGPDLTLKYTSLPMSMVDGWLFVTTEVWSIDNVSSDNSLHIYPNQTISIVTKNETSYLQIGFELEKAIVGSDTFVIPGWKAGEPLMMLSMLMESDENDVSEFSFLLVGWTEPDINITINPS